MTTLPKLLIAEGYSELQAAMAEAFSHSYQVKICGNGAQTRVLLESFRPDLLLLDLMLPGVDGITLLREIPEVQRPVTVAIALFTSPYIQAAMQQLQVSYMFLKPLCIPAVTDRVQELAANILPAPPAPTDPREQLYFLLRDMGLAPRADGFSYLLEAVPMYMRDPQQAMTKELYPDVGKRFHKSGASVERSIRSAIEGAWKRGGYKSWGAYFPVMPDGTIPKPSNSTFLSAVAVWLMQQNREDQRAV